MKAMTSMIIIFTLVLFACDTVNIGCREIIKVNACGIEDIGNNLPWLNDIITASIDDKTGNYLGKIWCKEYNGQDYIITNMALGSGGIAYHTFNCAGESAPVPDEDFYNTLADKEIIWISYCIE